MRKNLSFEERAFQKKKKFQVLGAIGSIEDCLYDEPDHIKNKVSLYCVVVLLAYTTIKLRRKISFKLPLAP